MLRDAFVCWSCGAHATDCDHIVPLSLGGDPFDLDNLRAACAKCNRGAGAAIASARRHLTPPDGPDSGGGAPLPVAAHGTPSLWTDGPDCDAAPDATPLHATPATTGSRHRLDEVTTVARELGFALVGWQRFAVRVATEADDDGLPRYRNVVVSVPRQCGKTTLGAILAVLQVLLHPGSVALWVAAAQSAAVQSWRSAHRPLWERAGLAGSWGTGSAWLRCPTSGSRIVLASGQRNNRQVHGLSADLVVADECWSFESEVEAAVTPTVRARRCAQMWWLSTYGVGASQWWLDFTDRGRQAAEASQNGRRSSTAFLEFGLPAGGDPDNESAWRDAVPAVDLPSGIGTTTKIMRSEHEIQDPLTWRHESLNMRPAKGGERLISMADWEHVCHSDDDSVEMLADGLVVGVDVNPRRDAGALQAATIVLADPAGAVRVLEHRGGMDWLAAALPVWLEKHRPAAVTAMKGAGCEQAVRTAAAAAGVEVVVLGGPGRVLASERFLRSVTDRWLRVEEHSALTAAALLAVARQQSQVSGWAFSPPNWLTSVSPLWAAVMAHHVSLSRREEEGWHGDIVKLDLFV